MVTNMAFKNAARILFFLYLFVGVSNIWFGHPLLRKQTFTKIRIIKYLRIEPKALKKTKSRCFSAIEVLIVLQCDYLLVACCSGVHRLLTIPTIRSVAPVRYELTLKSARRNIFRCSISKLSSQLQKIKSLRTFFMQST